MPEKPDQRGFYANREYSPENRFCPHCVKTTRVLRKEKLSDPNIPLTSFAEGGPGIREDVSAPVVTVSVLCSECGTVLEVIRPQIGLADLYDVLPWQYARRVARRSASPRHPGHFEFVKSLSYLWLYSGQLFPFLKGVIDIHYRGPNIHTEQAVALLRKHSYSEDGRQVVVEKANDAGCQTQWNRLTFAQRTAIEGAIDFILSNTEEKIEEVQTERYKKVTPHEVQVDGTLVFRNSGLLYYNPTYKIFYAKDPLRFRKLELEAADKLVAGLRLIMWGTLEQRWHGDKLPVLSDRINCHTCGVRYLAETIVDLMKIFGLQTKEEDLSMIEKMADLHDRSECIMHDWTQTFVELSESHGIPMRKVKHESDGVALDHIAAHADTGWSPRTAIALSELKQRSSKKFLIVKVADILHAIVTMYFNLEMYRPSWYGRMNSEVEIKERIRKSYDELKKTLWSDATKVLDGMPELRESTKVLVDAISRYWGHILYVEPSVLDDASK